MTEYEIMREQMLEMKAQRDEWIDTYKHFRQKVSGWVQDHEGMVAKVMALQQERDAWMRKWQELDSAPVPSAAEHHRLVEECRRRLQDVVDLKLRLAEVHRQVADLKQAEAQWLGANFELSEELRKLKRKRRESSVSKKQTKRRRSVRAK